MRQLLRRRRGMKELITLPPHLYAHFVRTLQSSCRRWVIERPKRHNPVQLEDPFWCYFEGAAGRDVLHCSVVVRNHLLAAVTRRAPGSQHLFGDPPRGGGALQLGGSDRLLNQAGDDITVPGGRVGDAFGHSDPATCLLIDRVEHLSSSVGEADRERPALHIEQRR